MIFDWNSVVQYLIGNRASYFLEAAWITLWISVVAQAAGVLLGLILALLLLSRRAPIRWPAHAYIWFFRGSPLLIQVFILFYGLPALFQGNEVVNAILSSIVCVLLAFSFNEGAYMAEIIRAGILSVDKGQTEAAKALGMTSWQAMRRIILPQAARVVVPPLGNEFNNMLKNTSIASTIGIYELTGTANIYGTASYIRFELLIVATVYYLFFTTIWGFIQNWIERRLNVDRTETSNVVGWAQRLFGFRRGVSISTDQ